MSGDERKYGRPLGFLNRVDYHLELFAESVNTARPCQGFSRLDP